MCMFACAGNQPSVKIIGLGEASQTSADRLVMLVEVVNPSQTEMVLSRLQYSLKCDTWAPVSGTVALARRAVRPKSSEILQIPIRAKNAKKRVDGLSYEFKGRLFSVDQRLERSWRVSAKGTFASQSSAVSGPSLRVIAIR